MNTKHAFEDENLFEAIEKYIDRNSVGALMLRISDICHAKGQHIIENWQDGTQARLWSDAGSYLYKVAHTKTLRRVA